VLAHEPDGGACQVERRLVERGFEVDTHVVTFDYEQPNRAEPFPTLDRYDLLAPMGSVRSLTELDPIDSWIHDELELVRAAHHDGMPILGVCFGGQLIAAALGGSVERAPVTEIGWYQIDDGPDGPNPVGPGPWLEWHHDRFIPPPGADVLAITDDAVQLIRIGSTVGTQFHPEVDLAHVTNWLGVASPEYLAEHGVDAEALLAETARRQADNIAQCHRLVDWFLDEVVAGSVRSVSRAEAS
jgi:GMP synthase-like glutamine amidotransferase